MVNGRLLIFEVFYRYEFRCFKKLFKQLRDYLELHHDNSIINMLKLVKNTVNVLESGESEVFKSEYVLELYKSLCTGRVDLTEYYIWDNDYNTRMKLNEAFWKNKKWFVEYYEAIHLKQNDSYYVRGGVLWQQ